MPSYVIAGASRGIGLQFVLDLLARGDVVIALARNPEASEGLQNIKDRKNLHIIKADIADAASLRRAAEETARVTGGALDVLINNGVYQDKTYIYNTLVDFPSTEELVSDFTKSFDTNVLGPILTSNAFLPLLKKGTQKKVITLNTGLADTKLISKIEYPKLTSYSISKAALDMVNVKYAIALKNEGFSFLNISPGLVDTQAPPKPEEMGGVMEMITAFKKGYPDWTPMPMPTAESVGLMLEIIDKLTVEDSGKFVSHKNNREWL
ncbi:NAD-P-binding protein [Dendrothele bispora CBS 962.96]|uniref:NAD-P-binding protein n=1 Tax=Dendrothele bispora (strain CBS 962.96) TaxID=1314807 RepID=A0A4S8MNE0_DENBC|nr:NAD-P-binding protein [Dendrothele bispora CBS 962.96]